jgi:uncharacterized RDD family membrane protein YckC
MSNLPFSPPELNHNQNPDRPPTAYSPPPGQSYPPGTPLNPNNPPPPFPPPLPGNTPYGYRPYYYNYTPAVAGELVGFWPRAIALIIDSIIIGIPTGIFNGFLNLMVHPFWNDWGGWPASQYTFGWSTSIIFWGLYAWFCYTNLRGNTLGKSVMGIKLVYADGSKPSLQTYILHFSIGYWINQAVLLLGYIWAIFDANKQTWGQKIFKDYTVRGNW